MTVPTISTLNSGSEGSSKLLNDNSNIDNSDSGLSFSATMNDTASNLEFDDQRYVLSDGQVLTAEQLLEMLENGNSLPGINLPTLSELQQYKFQEGLNNSKYIPLVNNGIDDRALQFETTNKLLNEKFVLTQQQFLNQQISQNQSLKSGVVSSEQFLVAMNAANATSNNEMPATGITTAYGYQLMSGSDGTSGMVSNSLNISTPIQHPQWNQSLGQSVKWIVNQNIQQAEIKLNPPELGMIDIRITVNNDQATVHFSAQNSVVRDALESAIPRLRDMLEESGVSLVDVNVSEHSQEHTLAEQDSENSNKIQSSDHDDDTNMGLQNDSDINSRHLQIGLLDTYA